MNNKLIPTIAVLACGYSAPAFGQSPVSHQHVPDGLNSAVEQYLAGDSGNRAARRRRGDIAVRRETLLIPSSTQASSLFGVPVAVDGDTAVMGSASGGVVFVYRRVFGQWVEEQELTTTDNIAGYGTIVDIEGDRIIVGNFALLSADAPTSVYVYRRGVDQTWRLEQTLRPDTQREAVASAKIKGNTIFMAVRENFLLPTPDQNLESIYVFKRRRNQWQRTQVLTASDGMRGDNFGFRMARSGRTLFAVAFGAQATYVFRKNRGRWQEVQKLMPASPSAVYGTGLALEGNTAVVGDPLNDTVYVYRRFGGYWQEKQRLTAGPSGNQFGISVDINDGTVAVGARTESPNEALPFSGATYLFQRDGAAWQQALRLVASDSAPFLLYGTWVALDRRALVVGAVGINRNTGGAYVYDLGRRRHRRR